MPIILDEDIEQPKAPSIILDDDLASKEAPPSSPMPSRESLITRQPKAPETFLQKLDKPLLPDWMFPPGAFLGPVGALINPSVAGAAAEETAHLAQGLTTPKNLAIAGAAVVAPEITLPALAGFAVPASIKEAQNFGTQLGSGNLEEAARSAVRLTAGAAQIMGGVPALRNFANETGDFVRSRMPRNPERPPVVEEASNRPPIITDEQLAAENMAEMNRTRPDSNIAVEEVLAPEKPQAEAPKIILDEQLESPGTQAVQRIEEPAATPPPEIPLGLDREAKVDANLRSMDEKAFDTEYRASRKEVYNLEKKWDETGELTPDERQQLAIAQDRFTASQLERFRRNNEDTHTADIFHEMTQLADTAQMRGSFEEVSRTENFQKFRILADILEGRREGGEQMMEVFQNFPEQLKSNPDFQESLKGRLDDVKQGLQYVYEAKRRESVPVESEVTREQPKLLPERTEPPIEQGPSTQSLGILPPGAAQAGEAAVKTAKRLSQLREGFSNWTQSREVRGDIVRKLDAADNEAKIEGQQIGNSLKLDLPSKADRDAVTFIVEANGDRARLDEFLAKVGDKNADAANAIRRAQKDWDRLSPVADRVNQLHDEQLQYEQQNGVDPGNVEGYVRHAYDMDAMIGKGRPVLLSRKSGGSGVSSSFKKQRTFETYADAIEAGFKPRSFDIADLVQSRITIGERLINRMKWADSLRSIEDPAEGTPIVQSLITQDPKGTQVAPMGYVPREVMPGVRVAVHEGYSDLIDALTGSSRIRANPVGRALLNTTTGIKHFLLLGDTFHAGKMIYKELALTGKVKHDLGRSLLEYSDADLKRAVDAGEIPQEAADWSQANRPIANLLIENGLNVGRVSDALYKDVVSAIPGVGRFTKWVFDKLTRGAMLQSAVSEFDRLSNTYPGKSPKEVATIVAKDVNSYYGNLGRQGLFKDPTFQDLARLVFLAPQWVEGMARTELGAAGQIGKIPIDAATGKGLVVGSLAKGVGTGVLATFVANQLLNYASRGKPTWENEEHGHQLDAYIPDATGKGNGFFLSPLSVFAELTHDAVRYYEQDPHALKVASRIASNKLSPLARSEEVLRTGKDWMGKNLDGTWDRIKTAGEALIPAPIPLQSGLPGRNSPPGSLQRQLIGSLGIKVEPAPSAQSQLYQLATQFKEKQGIKEPAREPSEYGPLNNALRDENIELARKEYQNLVDQKSVATVRQHYADMNKGNLYTGKRVLEAKFLNQLSQSDRRLIPLANEERKQLSKQFFQMLNTKE